MTQLEKIRKAKGFLKEDVAKASGVNTSITDVGPKLTVANDSKTENKIINLRKSLNTLANNEGEEISQFFQANLDAGIIDEDMLHILTTTSMARRTQWAKILAMKASSLATRGSISGTRAKKNQSRNFSIHYRCRVCHR